MPDPAEPSALVRVAVDLLGGDDAPASVIAGVTTALRHDPMLSISLVGPERLCRAAVTNSDTGDRVSVVPASQVVDMAEKPVDGVRGKGDATVAVAADLISTGGADAMVSIGSTGAAVAASVFTFGLLPGISRPALAVTLPAATGDVVLLDVGANVISSATIIAEHALLGAAYAHGRLGLDGPAVGLLTIGAEDGKGDRVRQAAFRLLRRLPLHFVGNVEGDDVLRGGVADVVVTDGFTGNVLLKGMEGTFALLASLLSKRIGRGHGQLRAAFEDATNQLHPDRVAGAMLLGVDGVVVIGHGASSHAAIAACIGQAADAVRSHALAELRDTLAELVAAPAGARVEALP